jgi:glycosyltransferase involved in cell wall biosynthesis
MRILVINDRARPMPGGMNRMVTETCNGLLAAGHEVAVAYHDGLPPMIDCPTFNVSWDLPLAARCAKLVEVARDYRPDVIQNHSFRIVPALGTLAGQFPTCAFFHDQGWFCSGHSRMSRDFEWCARPHGVSCLMWHYAQGCGGRSPAGNLRRWLDVSRRVALSRIPALRIQVASQFMQAGLRQHGFPAERIDVIPLFAEPAAATGEVEPGTMLLPSRFVKAKGVHLAIEAMTHLKDTPARLVIAGDGPLRIELEAFTCYHDLRSQVQFLGELVPAELAPWYARAQVVLFPVVWQEPFGLVGIEAMAYAKPLISFGGGGIDEWLEPGVTGLRVPERTAKSLAAAMRELISDPARARRMGEAARSRYDRFRPAAYLERLLASLERTRAWFRKNASR